MADRAKAKGSSRKIRKPKKTTESPRRTNTVPQVPPPPAQKLAHRSFGNPQLSPSNSPDQDFVTQTLEKLHPQLLGNLSYRSLSQAMSLTDECLKVAPRAATTFIEQMHPKDPLDALELMQALLAHARAAWLTKLASKQSNVQTLAIINEAADHASGTFIRLLRARAEYLQPKNPSATVSIGQANVAQQQVVHNVQKREGMPKEDDEQTRINERGAVIDAKTVPVVEKRVEGTEGCNPGNETVGEEHGAKKPGRKSCRRNEPAAPRRAVSRSHRAAKAGPTDD